MRCARSGVADVAENQRALGIVLHVEVRVMLEFQQGRLHDRACAHGPEVLVFHHPHGRTAGAETDVRHAVLGRLDE